MPIPVACAVSVGDCIGSADGRCVGIDRFGEAEVQDFDCAVRTQLDVGRLQVAVDDADLMRGFERLGDLTGDGQCLVDRNGPPRDALGEVFSFDELHDDRARAARLLDAVDLRNVRVVEGGEHLRLSLEPGHAVAARSCRGWP